MYNNNIIIIFLGIWPVMRRASFPDVSVDLKLLMCPSVVVLVTVGAHLISLGHWTQMVIFPVSVAMGEGLHCWVLGTSSEKEGGSAKLTKIFLNRI